MVFVFLFAHSNGCKTMLLDAFSVRQNGLLVFLPKYGLRGPLFMADTHGTTLIPPAAFSHGVSATGRASAAAKQRATSLAAMGRDAVEEALHSEAALKQPLPMARVLCDRQRGLVTVTPPPSVEDVTPPQPLRVGMLDCVLVQVSCDFSQAHVRRPPLRYRLVAATPLALALSKVGYIHPSRLAARLPVGPVAEDGDEEENDSVGSSGRGEVGAGSGSRRVEGVDRTPSLYAVLEDARLEGYSIGVVEHASLLDESGKAAAPASAVANAQPEAATRRTSRRKAALTKSVTRHTPCPGRITFGNLPPLEPEAASLVLSADFGAAGGDAGAGVGGGSHGASSAAVLKSDRSVRSATAAAERRIAKRLAGVRHAKTNARRKANR